MPSRVPLTVRLRTASRWPAGILLTSWRYMWRTVPMHRSEVAGSPEADGPPALPDGPLAEGVHHPPDGAGPLFRRRYSGRIREAKVGAHELMATISSDLDRVAPTEFASFTKVQGETGTRTVGDEYVVRMPGPWDGPVRVIERTPASFRFVTLPGHLEAGQIHFEARDGELLEFTIESWARAGDWLSNLLFEHLRMSKEIQLHMWTSVMQRVAERSGGRLTGGIEIRTRRVEQD